ncbi:unnamed protein product [Parnassius apollo]|uniref:(apollo) hypothetical protein n=1 Tax=Parnassius apollo TaxID=110799 RepID=A0A8S3XU09_PARAO|nr:unnamed protein product [Parnassius apollo]
MERRCLLYWEIENALSVYVDIPSDDGSYAGGDGSDIEDEVIIEGQSTTLEEIFLEEDFQGTGKFDSEDDTPLTKLSFFQLLVPSSSPESQPGPSTPGRLRLKYRLQNEKKNPTQFYLLMILSPYITDLLTCL